MLHLFRFVDNSLSPHIIFPVLATRDTIEMTNKMAEAGANAALVVTPCFYKNGMTSEALEKHFNKVKQFN